jgi:hypothetical protein
MKEEDRVRARRLSQAIDREPGEGEGHFLARFAPERPPLLSTPAENLPIPPG